MQNCRGLLISYLLITRLLESVLAQALAADGEVFHIFGNGLAQILVHIELGQVLAEHEAVSTQTGQQTDLGIDNVARLDVVAGPDGMEADGCQVGYPLGEHLADDLEEGLTVVLQVLACLIGVAVG